MANAEISARLQLYLGTLSSAIIALALTAQLSWLASGGFALVLLPVVYFLGVVTHGRLLQLIAEWRTYGQGMNRIRHYFLEFAPQMDRYLVLPATDDPWATLARPASAPAVTLMAGPADRRLDDRGGQQRPGRGLHGLLWRSLDGSSGPVPLALSAAVGFLVSPLSLGLYGQRAFRRGLAASPVAFPAGPTGEDR